MSTARLATLICPRLMSAKAAEVPWEKDYSLPIEGLLAAKPQAIYIANPNAPTGTFVSPLRIAELARSFTLLKVRGKASKLRTLETVEAGRESTRLSFDP